MERRSHQWELASVFGTALGTTLFAAATGALAYSTWSDVRATSQLADLTKGDQDERQRPVVLQQDAVFDDTGPLEGWLIVTFNNVGLGPALRVEVEADYSDEDGSKPWIESTTIPAISPANTASVQLFVRFPELRKKYVTTAFDSRGRSPTARGRACTRSSRSGDAVPPLETDSRARADRLPDSPRTRRRRDRRSDRAPSGVRPRRSRLASASALVQRLGTSWAQTRCQSQKPRERRVLGALRRRGAPAEQPRREPRVVQAGQPRQCNGDQERPPGDVLRPCPGRGEPADGGRRRLRPRLQLA